MDEFDIDLKSIEIICTLLDKYDNETIGNLDVEQVQKMDQTVDILGLDQYRWRYYQRSRLND